MKNEKQKEEENEVNSKIIDNKDSELKQLLQLEEDLMGKIHKARQAKKGIDSHYDEYISKENFNANKNKRMLNQSMQNHSTNQQSISMNDRYDKQVSGVEEQSHLKSHDNLSENDD